VRPVAATLALIGLCLTQVATAQSLVCVGTVTSSGPVASAGTQATCQTYAAGSVCPLDQQTCAVDAAGVASCPGNPGTPCVATGTSTSVCSPDACLDPSTIAKTVTTIPPPAASGGGAVAPNGACLGTLHIFPGTGKSCRNVGIETAFTNCCNSNTAMNDTMGNSGGSNQIDALNTNLSDIEKQIVDHCTPADEATDFQANSGQCIHIGDYCAQSWPLIGCVQSARSYCCFNSMLARIIQQQGRPQIPSMGDFGTPTAPNCRGFTIKEFESLDFSKIDLSEYTAEIKTNSQAAMEQTVNGIATQRLSNH
jgi:conjugal transfer mating pair stabilization protein TraN